MDTYSHAGDSNDEEQGMEPHAAYKEIIDT